MPFSPFSCFMKLAKAFGKCLNRSGESKTVCLAPNIRRNPFFILSWNMMLLYIFIDFLDQVQRVPFLVIWGFCHECMWNLFKCLSGSTSLNTCFSLYSVKVWILTNCFLNVNLTFLRYIPLGHEVLSSIYFYLLILPYYFLLSTDTNLQFLFLYLCLVLG